VKTTLMFVCLLSLCSLTLLAQTGQSPRVMHTKEGSAIHVPPQEPPAGLKTIYSNLGKSKTDLYLDTWGYLLSGPNSGVGVAYFDAIPFTPKSDSHVSEVEVAVQYLGAGANQVNLSIYSNSGGVPGTLLAGPVTVTNLPDAGTCCTLAVASFTPLAVTAATQYWVVGDTPLTGTGSDFEGWWAFVVQGTTPPVGTYYEESWSTTPGLEEAAGEVLGTIP
jgi:hypothetical protein